MTHQKRAKRWGYSVSLLAILIAAVVTSPAVTAEVQDVPEVSAEATNPTETGTNFSEIEPYVRGTEGSTTFGNWSRRIHYVYEDGTQAAETVEQGSGYGWSTRNNPTTHEITEVYYLHHGATSWEAVISPEIEGFTADIQVVPEVLGLDATDDSWGRYKPRSETITVTYRKNSDTPASVIPDPSDPETSGVTEKPEVEVPDSPTVNLPVTSEITSPTGELENLSQIVTEPIVTIEGPVSTPQSGRKVLPSTGESTGNTIVPAGGIAVLGGAVLGLAAHLKRKKN